MRLFLRFYKYFNILSLDIVLGALSGGIMAVKIFNTALNYRWLIVLGLSVWIIYTSDHLLDSIKLKNRTYSERRLFYYKYYKFLLLIELLLTVVVLYIVFNFFQIKLIKAGFIIIALSCFYFFMVFLFHAKRTLFLQKEMIVAFIYTTGIFIAPIVKVYPNISMGQIIITIAFFLIVWSDILLIAIFEYKKDIHDHFTSLPIMLGIKNTEIVMQIGLYTAIALLFYVNIFYSTNRVYLSSSFILLIMSLLQIFIYQKKSYLELNEKYRYFTEAIFFLPVFMIFA